MNRRIRQVVLALLVATFTISGHISAATPERSRAATARSTRLTEGLLQGLAFRNIGPALMSGRIGDVMKDPRRKSTWYVAVSSGGVWKTTNAGTTWRPIFDRSGSFSIGTIALDPTNPDIVWVGTGEANATRSVAFGDGIYKSTDAGRTWKKMGLERSEHIARIVFDPRDSNVMFVASQGPLWSPGGDRGLYKTTDGGVTWKPVLEVSENTGISDVVIDPANPDILYAASYQRRRHAGMLVGGGPEGAIYKSTDGGGSWRKIMRGLPGVDLGRIGLAVSPQQPNVLYAIVAAARGESGFFRSADRGETWERRSNYIVVDPQYYMRLFPDPHRFDTVYAVDVELHVTEDGGKTFREVPGDHKHGDHHAMHFDDGDADYLMVGTDGGLYESWDRGQTWKYHENLPVAQFYRVGLDEDLPFYNVYGGTQDNGTLGGPSRTTSQHGIRNSDWRSLMSGDGWQVRVDPTDPNIVYFVRQGTELRRYDRRTGETVDIRPTEEKGEPPARFLWDTPHIISPHSHTRLYLGGNRVYRSDDRGDSWRVISPDLSRGLDRNRLEVMGKVWSVDAVWKNVFTNDFGTVISLSESQLQEGLLYAGTDDGLIHVTENGGANWQRAAAIPQTPELACVADVVASRHDSNVLYAVLNNHQRGDFASYVYRSNDRGRTWTSIVGDLPQRQPAWSLMEDHVNPHLLFLGTEFGVFFTIDGGQRWIPLEGSIPTIAIRDLEIQRRESDLVAASFGRGMFILDDYSPLRSLSPELLEREAELFPVRRAWSYIPTTDLGWGSQGHQGDGFFRSPNPPLGAVFTYYLRNGLTSLKDLRAREESAERAAGRPVTYPTWNALRAEERETSPAVLFTITDADGRLVRRLRGPAQAGIHRIAWDLRHVVPGTENTDAGGPLAAPGRYTVRMSKFERGVETELSALQQFDVVRLNAASQSAEESKEALAFALEAARLQSAVTSARRVIEERDAQLVAMQRGLREIAGNAQLADRANVLRERLLDLRIRLVGDEIVRRRREPTTPSIRDRVGRVVNTQWESTTSPNKTRRRDYEIAAEEFAQLRAEMQSLIDGDLAALERAAGDAGVTWRPNVPLPQWSPAAGEKQ